MSQLFAILVHFLPKKHLLDQTLDGVEIRQSKINSRSVAGPMGQMNHRPSV